MDSSVIARKYFGSVKNGKIPSVVLKRLPKLVTVHNWSEVELLGYIDFTAKVPAVHYAGLLAHYKGGLYFITNKLAESLGKLDKRFIKVKNKISVVSE